MAWLHFKQLNNIQCKILHIQLLNTKTKSMYQKKTQLIPESHWAISHIKLKGIKSRTACKPKECFDSTFHHWVSEAMGPRDCVFRTMEVAFTSATFTVTCTVKRPPSKDRKLVSETKCRLMQAKSIAEYSKGSILQYFRPSLIYHLSLSFLFCLFLSGRFT